VEILLARSLIPELGDILIEICAVRTHLAADIGLGHTRHVAMLHHHSGHRGGNRVTLG
jgi:hypothetical protein